MKEETLVKRMTAKAKELNLPYTTEIVGEKYPMKIHKISGNKAEIIIHWFGYGDLLYYVDENKSCTRWGCKSWKQMINCFIDKEFGIVNYQ